MSFVKLNGHSFIQLGLIPRPSGATLKVPFLYFVRLTNKIQKRIRHRGLPGRAPAAKRWSV